MALRKRSVLRNPRLRTLISLMRPSILSAPPLSAIQNDGVEDAAQVLLDRFGYLLDRLQSTAGRPRQPALPALLCPVRLTWPRRVMANSLIAQAWAVFKALSRKPLRSFHWFWLMSEGLHSHRYLLRTRSSRPCARYAAPCQRHPPDTWLHETCRKRSWCPHQAMPRGSRR